MIATSDWIKRDCRETKSMPPSSGYDNTNYESLSEVLNCAYEQAAYGKGKERHAENESYEKQPIMWIEKYFKSYQLGQAVKKMHESQRLSKEMAVQELLGAINYIAAKIIFLNKEK